MKLLNFNIGATIANHAAVVALIEKLDIDIVCLQEVIEANDDKALKKYRSREFIDKKLGGKYPYNFFTRLWQSGGFLINGVKVFDPKGMITQGNYIISKYPFAKTSECFYHGSFAKITDWSHFETEDHGRAIQVVEVSCAEGCKLTLLNIHGIWTKNKLGDKRTDLQTEKIISLANKNHCLIAGDFNLLPNTNSLKPLRENFVDLNEQYAVRSTRPNFKDHLDEGNVTVDYIFCGKKIKVIDYRVIETNISDHYPICIEFACV